MNRMGGRKLNVQQLPLFATAAVFVVLYAIAAFRYPGFFSARVLANFFTDNAVLGIVAVGMTFVILGGGIDLSVGGMIGLSSILLARLIETSHLSALLAAMLLIVLGAGFGAAMGALIQFFALPPFLVTLGGMFFARGLGFVIALQSISISNPTYAQLAEWRLPLWGKIGLPLTAIVFILVFVLGLFLAHGTRFGRNVYALGGNENSALLMGLPVAATKIGIYSLSGALSALAGVVFTLYTFSGNPTAGNGLELDAIAAVVIGGTLLTGGVGYMAGTLLGVLIFGVIQTALTFEGTLSSWWTRIAIGGLLLIFILLQKVCALGSAHQRVP